MGVIGWGLNDKGQLDIPAGAQYGASAITMGYGLCLAIV
nr:hypothetical protein [Kibdelosporangium sp. MJ126-NF4]CTQ88576.1 hypothetical protein [Kibdelosporangium sp. MJ126-NF4]